jgi:hypothetical protein
MTPFWSIERGHCPVNFIPRPLIVAIGMIALSVPAAAQITMPPQSNGGLFGSGPGGTAKTMLEFNASLIEGYDSDAQRALVPSIDPTNLQNGGFSTLLNTGAAYQWRGKAQLSANVNSVLRHYAELGTTQSLGHRAGIGVSTAPFAGWTLFANQSAAFSPAYFYGLFPASNTLQPGNAGVTAPDYTVPNYTDPVNSYESYSYTTSTSLTHGIGSRGIVSLAGQFMYTDRVQETPRWSDISSYSLSTQYSRKTSRNVAFATELHYRSGQFGYRGEGKTTELALQGGVDYTRPVSGTRQVTLGMHAGVSSADYPISAIDVTGFQRQYRTIADLTVSYPLSHMWSASGSLRRGLEYETDLPIPVVNNGATLSLSGLLTPRVDVLLSGGYATGESILNRDSLLYNTYTGNARVRYAVSRTFALFAEYLYYYYDIRNGVLLQPGMPPGLRRNGVRTGLTLWMPAVRR